ncbi:MAG: T9SS type A sorting domain-containing protein [Bacteroidota bacterium]|nr:T9SS type A sorting domain-containing protein [Bacteroidota bacterium]
MKNFFTFLIVVICLTMLGSTAWGQRTVPTIDHFDYLAGELRTVGVDWSRISGTTNDLNVVDGNLSYSGYPMPATGRQVRILSTGVDDLKLTFTNQATDKIYASFLLNVINTTGLGAGAYFAILGSGTSQFQSRIFIRSDGSGFDLGLAKNSATVAGWSDGTLSVGTTYLVVVNYEFVSGTTNDTARLWVNPDMSGSEPPANVITGLNADADINGFFIRQASGTSNSYIDGLRIAKTWAGIFPPSSSSDIIANVSFTYPTNIDYASNTGTNVTSSNPEVFQLDIRDGGGSADDDALSTTLTAITFSVTNSSVLEKIALYDGTSELQEVDAGASITFSGLTVAAADDGSYTLNLRATYKTTVTDNTQFSFTVTSATADPSGSTFAAGNAGGATSSVSGDNNRIEVTATKYNFSTQPPATTVVDTDFAAGVEALDANNNRDLDDATSVTLAASAGLLSSATGVVQNLSSGVYDWTDLQNNTAGTGVSLSATGTHTTANSNTMTILSAEPTTQASVIVFSNVLTTSMDVSWTSGNGNNRIVIAKQGSAPTFTPSDGSTYSFDNDFSIAPTQGDAKVVYKGSSNSFTLSGLTQNTTYHVAVFEFNNPEGTENYLITSPATGDETTTASVSTASDILAAGNETANIAYASYQASSITTTSDGVRLWSFQIRDGGGSADGDAFGTEMTSVSITKGSSNGVSSWANTLRRAALFNGSNLVAEVGVAGESISFSGLSGSYVTAPDDGNTTLDLYVTFESAVTDNEQFQFQITNSDVTAAGSNSSLFTTFSAQTSNVTSDANRIEVTATKLNFSTQPPATTVVNTNFAAGVEALDANNNRDLDDATSVSLAASAGSLTSATGIPQNLSSGVYNWTDLQNNTAGTGVTLQATGGSLTLANSSSMTIYSAEPTSQASISGFSSVTTNSMTVDLSAGDGSYRIVLAKSGSAVNASPVDGATYSPSSTFGSGDEIGTGNYVIFAGSGTSAPVSGLTAGTTYHFTVFEFNGSGGTENYKTPGGIGSQITSGETYTWNQTGSASWAVSTNWTPTRTTPATNDILQFNGGGTVTATSVPTQTIGQLLVSNSSTVNLQAGGAVTLTISGGSGVDLSVAAGSALNCNVANAITIFVGTGATGSISGTMTYTSAAHKLNAQDESAITFQSGSIMTQGTGMTGNIFTNSGTANVVIFANGSTFIFQAGSNPFGLSAPNSKVVFQSGSLYKHETTGFPSLDNRVYANYEYNASGTCSPTSGSTGTTMEDITVTQGTFNLNPNFTTNIKGDVSIAGGATLGFSASTAATVNFNGTSTQTISGGGTLTFGANTSIIIASGADVVLSKSIAISQAITVNGALDCGTSVISGTGGSVSVSNGATLKVGSTSGSGAIEGNISATGGVTLASGSTVECNGSAAQYLAARTFDDLTINNSSGVSLVGNITMNDVLLLSSGDLTTGSYSVDLGSTGTLTETAGNTVIGNVTVTRTVTSPQTFGGIGFEMDSYGDSPGSTTITRVTGVGQGPAAQSVKRYFDITPTNNSGLNVNATFHYDESELNGRDEATLEMWKSIDNGVNWTEEGGTPSPTNNTVTLNNVSSFSRWTLTDDANPLIVTGSQLSDVIAGVLSIPATISSLVDTQPEQVAVFDFTVRDGGASGDADLTGTILNYIQLAKGSNNTVSSWSASILGAELFNGVNSLGTATITADNVSWSGSPIVTVPDDGSLTLTVKIYLKTSLPAGSDGKVFEFKINQNTDVTVDASGSYMAPGGTDVVGTPGTTIDVQATQLAFTTHPQSGLLVGSNIAPVAVTAQDVNGNKDGDYTGNVTLSSGTFTLASTDVGGLTQTASAGVASWTNLTSSTSGTGTVLADASTMTQGVSNSITVTSGTVTSFQNGNWSVGSTWVGGVKPAANQAAIIASGHTVTLTATDTCEAATVQTGGVLDLATFALQLRGTFTAQAGAELKISLFNPLPGNGPTPYAFDIASLFTIGGGATGFGYRNPAVQTVTFGNVHWNSTGNATPSGTMIVAGNLLKSNTGELRCGTGSTTSRTVYVYGNVTVNGGIIVLSNSTSPITGELDVNGDLTINSGAKLRGVNFTGSGTLRIGGNLINNGGIVEEGDGGGDTGDFFVIFKGTNTSNFDPGAANVFRTVQIAAGRTVNLINNNLWLDSTRSAVSGSFYLGTNLIIGKGTFELADGGTLGIGSPDGITTSGATGNVQVTGTRTFSSLANYVYNGTVAQVTGNGFPANCNNLTINNSAGVTLSSDHTVDGVLTLLSGNVITGPDKLIISSTGSVSRTSGHIFGNLQMHIPTGTGVSRTFEIGDASNYTPILFTAGTVTNLGELTATVNPVEHPQIATSQINSNKSVNRYYIFTNSGVVLDNYSATFNFVSGDVDLGANPLVFVAKRYDGVNWNPLTMGTRTSTSTEVTGVTSFSDFAIGELSDYTLTINIVGSGSVLKNPDQATYTHGQIVELTANAAEGWTFAGWSGDLLGSETPKNITMDGPKTVTATFTINTYTLNVSVVGGGTVTKAPDQPTYNYNTNVELTAIPDDLSWKFKEWSGDASGSTNPLTVVMNANKNITATFEEDANYLAMYRSFMPESIALDKDNKGKINKFVQRKPDKVDFILFVVSDSNNVNDLHMEFTHAIDTTFPFGTIPASVATPAETKLKKWNFVFSTPLDAGDTVYVYGYGNKGKVQKIPKYWWTRDNVLVGAKKKDPVFTRNQPKLPMPNRVNALAESFCGHGATGLVIGNVRTDSTKQYGWFQTTKYGDVLKTLIVKNTGQMHEGTPRGFDHLTGKTKDLVKQQKSLPPTKFDNKLLADMIALKVNITSSAMRINPLGFGELIYDDGTSNPLNGLMVKEIANFGDPLMMGQYDSALLKKVYAELDVFENLSATIEKINTAFEGPLDTAYFAYSLRFKGYKSLIEVPYLKANPDVIPAVIAPIAGSAPEIPSMYTLHQNYPNPFNPTTTISFELPVDAFVTLKIYNLLGQEVASLLDREELYEGTQEIEFNADGFASGVYFYHIQAEGIADGDEATTNFKTVKKMLLVR